MKTLLTNFLVFCFFIGFSTKSYSQYVTIPDPFMVEWLTSNYPTAMVGNQMDTTNVDIVNATAIMLPTFLPLDNDYITNLDGIQYFDNALYIEASGYIDTLISFPPNLTTINLQSNNLNFLPDLPGSLLELNISGNQLSFLPELPSTLTLLNCGYNNLLFLPSIPNSLQYLFCESNNLTFLPELPSTLTALVCKDNSNLSCLPLLPDYLYTLYIQSTSVNCLPNNPLTFLDIDIVGLPLCLPNNSNGCIVTSSISGSVFDNQNNDCINTQNQTTSTTFILYDGQNNFLQSRSSSTDYNYYFSIQPGEYIVRIDSSFSTNCVSLACPISGQHDIAALPDSSYANRDFGFNCVGTELGIEAISHQGIIFPGQPHSVKALAGDLSNFFGLNCATGTGGTVQVTVNGPVTYIGTSGNALTPTVSGNSYTYTVADFGSTNIQESFVLDFLTETTAQSGDLVTVSASIISNGTDLDATNNTLSYSYVVVNSYDPNMKEVNPVDVLPGYEDYFTYTVHFQNLGTAPAFNINIKDTLDSNLDFSTFRVINASHDYSYNLSGDLLTVYFQNIMLADSASDPEGSKGFVQYQVKPKANLPLGTSIENTAHIFFDFNEAVVTNTTINNFVEEVGINEIAWSEFSIYPNPSNGNITIVNQNGGNETLNIEIYDLLGKKLVGESLSFKNGSSNMSLSLAAGTYLISIGDNSKIQRLQIRD